MTKPFLIGEERLNKREFRTRLQQYGLSENQAAKLSSLLTEHARTLERSVSDLRLGVKQLNPLVSTTLEFVFPLEVVTVGVVLEIGAKEHFIKT